MYSGPIMPTTELMTRGESGRLGSPTRLVCAGGQSSSLTPNVPVAVGFFSNVFLIILGMPFLHVPLSFGGLVSSFDCYAKKKDRRRKWKQACLNHDFKSPLSRLIYIRVLYYK